MARGRRIKSGCRFGAPHATSRCSSSLGQIGLDLPIKAVMRLLQCRQWCSDAQVDVMTDKKDATLTLSEFRLCFHEACLASQGDLDAAVKLCQLGVLIIVAGCTAQPHNVANDGPDVQCHSVQTVGTLITKSECTTREQRAAQQGELGNLRRAVDSGAGMNPRASAP
jgi:hypothetical protein